MSDSLPKGLCLHLVFTEVNFNSCFGGLGSLLVITRVRMPQNQNKVFNTGCLKKDVCWEITVSDLNIWVDVEYSWCRHSPELFIEKNVISESLKESFTQDNAVFQQVGKGTTCFFQRNPFLDSAASTVWTEVKIWNWEFWVNGSWVCLVNQPWMKRPSMPWAGTTSSWSNGNPWPKHLVWGIAAYFLFI